MTGSTNHQVGILADNTTYQDFCLQSNMAAAMLEYQWVSLGLFCDYSWMMADMFIKNYDVKGFLKFDIPKPPA